VVAAETVEALSEGRLGFFWSDDQWPPELSDDGVERGWLQIDGRTIVLRVLDESLSFEDPFGRDEPERPSAIVGVLPDDGVLLLDVGWRRGTRVFGGERASSAKFDCGAVVGRIEPSTLRSPRLFEVSAKFPAMQAWADMTSMNESRTVDPSGIVTGWEMTTVAVPTQTAKLGSLTLALDADWSVRHRDLHSAIENSLRVSCSAARPRSVRELVAPIINVQDLMSLAYGGLVGGTGGSCKPHFDSSNDPRQTPSFWHGAVHGESADHLAPPNFKSRALFDLADLDGVAGLSRWARLCASHYRAVAPTVMHLRHGPPTAPGLIKDVAGAIEYWVKLHRPAAWASNRRFVEAFRTRIDASDFAEWCGNPDAWETAFWGAYNKLKHDPYYRWDELELSDLAISGRLLLTAGLLNRVALSHAPGRRIFAHHRVNHLGRRLRDRYS